MVRVCLSAIIAICLEDTSHVLRHTTMRESARFTRCPLCCFQTQHPCKQMHVYTGNTAVNIS